MLNRFYQDRNIITQIRKEFAQQGHVVLYDVVDQKTWQKSLESMRNLKLTAEIEFLAHVRKTASVPAAVREIVNTVVFQVLGKTPQQLRVYSYGWKEYSILHDAAVENAGTDIIFDFTSYWQDEWGGQLIYVNGTGNYTSFPIRHNMLIIKKRVADEQKFVKYVNHYAQKQRRLFLLGSV